MAKRRYQSTPIIKGGYGSEQAKVAVTVSRRLMCPRCKAWVLEHSPVVNLNAAKNFFAANKEFSQSKRTCQNGCHKNPGWGPIDIEQRI